MIRGLALAGAGLALLTACSSKEVDIPGIEAQVESGISDQLDVDAVVECPSQVDWKVGGEFHCIATADDGSMVRVTVTMENDDGEVTWKTD